MSQNVVSIDLSGFAGADKKISIADMKNNIVLEKTVSGTDYLLELNSISAAGIYVLTVKDEYKVRTEKLVIEK